MAEIVDLRGRQPSPAPPPVLADPSGRRARLLARVGRAIAIVFLAWLAGLALAGLGILPVGDVPLAPVIAAQSPGQLDRAPSLKRPTRADLEPALPSTSAAAIVGARTNVVHAASDPSDVRGGVSAAGGAQSRTGSVTHPRHRGASRTRTPGVAPLVPHRAVHVPGHTRAGSAPSAGSAGTAGGSAATTPAGNATHGASTTAHGKTAAPGQITKQTTPGQTSTSPGQTSTSRGQTNTAPGQSGSAPGQTRQPTSTQTSTSPGQSGSAPGQAVGHSNGHGNNN